MNIVIEKTLVQRSMTRKTAMGMFIGVCFLILADSAWASDALSGGGGNGMPWDTMIGVIWTSISTYVAPIAVGIGVIVGMLLMSRGSAGAAVYALFGMAMIGGVTLGINKIFTLANWTGCII